MQFTNHLSAGLCPDLLKKLTELGWLDPLAGCGVHREREEKGTRMGGGNVEGKGDKAYGSAVKRKGKENGRIKPWGRHERNGARRVEGEGGLRPISTSNLGDRSHWLSLGCIIIDCKLKKNDQISIVFGMNIPDKTVQ